jgi:hypothetical protein
MESDRVVTPPSWEDERHGIYLCVSVCVHENVHVHTYLECY